jgi:ATP-dependent helicase/nuclease subunit A
VSEIPWKITLSSRAEEGTAISVEEESQPELPTGTDMALRESLAFRYPHSAATQAPSKQTATQRKGREKDSEAAEAAKEPAKPHRMCRGPSFRNSSATGKDYGNAIHKAMQFICFEACTDHAAIRREIERLCAKGFLTKAEGEMVDCEVIARFFETDIGARLRGGCKHIREFKFSILDDAERYGDGLEGEKILLQGVVDCALVEEDGMTILDFKTDQVTEGTLAAAVERYRSQVETYGEAMERIYEMPVKQLYLYFFRLNRFVAL